jgi:hypothetical protein
MWLVLDDEVDGICVRRATAAERVLSRVRSRTLDRQLAQGASPDRDPLLALRARYLMQPGTRRSLANSVDKVLRSATAPSVPRWGSRVPVARGNVLDAADGLTALVEALSRQVPLSARGLAELELLMGDGVGPVYNPNSPERLPLVVHELLRTLAAVDS